jgi:hypothetical protein
MTCPVGAPLWDTTACQWACNDTPVPTGPLTGGNCYPLDRADTDGLKQACYTATDVASCSTTMCIWKGPPVPAGEIQLFTKEFCHPSEIDVSKFE